MGRLKLQNGDIDMAWYRSLLVTSILSFGFMGTLIALDENPSLRQPIEKKMTTGFWQFSTRTLIKHVELSIGPGHLSHDPCSSCGSIFVEPLGKYAWR